jgi:triacylglycerol esterase/lipase EstA (alpha/beta hydrolase family)
MMPRYYIKYLGGARRVEDLVGLAPSNHGTRVQGDSSAGADCVSCRQQGAGSRFLRRLNNPDETPGRVDYTQVVTNHDEVVVPYTSGYLTASRRSTNIKLQSRCPTDPAEHVSIVSDPQAVAWVLDAFRRRGPADRHARISCAG